MKNKNILLTLCMASLVSTAALGCTPAERPVPDTPQNINNNNRTITDNTMPKTEQVVPGDEGTLRNNRTLTENRMTTDNRTLTDNRMTTDNGMDTDNRMMGDLSDRADKIADEVTKLKDVKSATVVVTGNTALVGINLTSGTKGDLNTNIKKEVENAARKADKDIDRVSVTADPDLFTRIENMAKDIGKGQPLSGFGREIEEVIRRITPGA